jgi:hypothetical protein
MPWLSGKVNAACFAERWERPGLTGLGKNAKMEHQTAKTIYFALKANKIPLFFRFLQRGCMLKVQEGCSIKSLLCDQLGVSAEYVEERIKTIFLNGKTVDDVESATLRDGSTLALSAAMPGLVGSTFRRGGHLAAFRSQITHREEEAPVSRREVVITVKLFNLLVKELGRAFLDRGVWVKVSDLRRFLLEQKGEFWDACAAVKLDEEEVDAETVKSEKWPENGNLLFLEVSSSD